MEDMTILWRQDTRSGKRSIYQPLSDHIQRNGGLVDWVLSPDLTKVFWRHAKSSSEYRYVTSVDGSSHQEVKPWGNGALCWLADSKRCLEFSTYGPNRENVPEDAVYVHSPGGSQPTRELLLGRGMRHVLHSYTWPLDGNRIVIARTESVQTTDTGLVLTLEVAEVADVLRRVGEMRVRLPRGVRVLEVTGSHASRRFGMLVEEKAKNQSYIYVGHVPRVIRQGPVYLKATRVASWRENRYNEGSPKNYAIDLRWLPDGKSLSVIRFDKLRVFTPR
jgi:hypothetical protein